MSWHSGVKTGIGRPVLGGAVALTIGFGGFGTWAAMAPLEGAVIAPGTVMASGRNKVVQHLEGGIVKEILVEEGDRVLRDDPVIVLDATEAEAMRNRLEAQLNALAALEARIVAERNGEEEIAFPEMLLEKAHPSVFEVIQDQQAEFEARLHRHRAELGMLNQQIAALHEEIAGLEAQKQAVAVQLELIGDERSASETLLEKQLTTKPKVMELKRAEAELIGQGGHLTAGIAKAKQAIAEIEQQIQRLKVTRLEEASAQLSEVRLKRSDAVEQLRSAQHALDRIILRSPVTGTVMNLTKYNSGAVIAPGQDIMEVVPERAGTDLIVEAHVRPQDIDDVQTGQEARLNFSALDQGQGPAVPGEVIHVSADRLEDERTGEVYYLARLKISSEPLTGFYPSNVGPGQPVEVFITTGQRTLVAYLTDPITRTFRRAMREG